MRAEVVNPSMGTNLGSSALFVSPPILPYHLNGIVVSRYAKIAKNVVIC